MLVGEQREGAALLELGVDGLDGRDELEADGYRVAPFNFNPGGKPVDQHVDAPPYAASPHLKIALGGYVATSIGLIVHKP